MITRLALAGLAALLALALAPAAPLARPGSARPGRTSVALTRRGA